jgi:hypothetical protein
LQTLYVTMGCCAQLTRVWVVPVCIVTRAAMALTTATVSPGAVCLGKELAVTLHVRGAMIAVPIRYTMLFITYDGSANTY